MLTEVNRGYIIDDLQDNISFSYGDFEPTVNIYRYGEGFSRKHPYILIEFLPANRSRFRSISDHIGNATPAGTYKNYGFCQVELVSLYCYCGGLHDSRNVNGRLLTYELASTVLTYIQRNWEAILWNMNASFDRGENFFNIKDLTTYEPSSSSKIYCYSIDVYLRTPMTWNMVPSAYEGEEILETVVLYGKSTNEDEYELIKRIE